MKVADLFCGCGGLSLGLEKAGLQVAWACDNWDKAVEVYRANFDHQVSQMDVSNVFAVASKIRPLKVDGIVGGPPCQDFSSAGKRREGERANLTRSFADVIVAIKPRFFIMENVARAQSSTAFNEARDIFRGSGYGLSEVVLDASRCGVPQKRKRFFCVGILGAGEGYLLPIFEKHMASRNMSVRDYMGSEVDFTYYYRHPRNYNRRAIYSIDEPAATIRGVNRPVPDGYPGHRADATTLSKEIRSLTTKERARIQTFPANFEWDAAKSHLELMIGNAVPVELARFVGKCVLEGILQLERDKVPEIRRYG